MENKNHHIISLDIFSLYKIKEDRNRNNYFFIFIKENLEKIIIELQKSTIDSDKKIEDFRKLKITIIKDTIKMLNQK